MALTPTGFGGTALGTTAAVLYTCPANTKTIIKRAVFANVTAGAVTFTVAITRSGGASFVIINARSISNTGTGTDLAPELSNFELNAGDTISAFASAAASINAFGSGFLI